MASLATARLGRRAWLLAAVLLLALIGGACAVGTQKVSGTLQGNYKLTVTGTYTGNGQLQRTFELGLTVN